MGRSCAGYVHHLELFAKIIKVGYIKFLRASQSWQCENVWTSSPRIPQPASMQPAGEFWELKSTHFHVAKIGKPCPICFSLCFLTGLRIVDIKLDSQTVLVETSLGTEEVQNLLETTGRKAVLKGMGSNVPGLLGTAAVAIVSGCGLIQGVVRFLQVSPEKCLVDGTIDGLPPGLHGLHVHEFGDLSRTFDSCGDHFNPKGECHGGPQDLHRHAGDLGNILATGDGRASFRMEDHQLKVDDIIGRSLVVDEGEDDLGRGNHPLSKISGNSGER
uniref:Copper chaperone for superoxide dismutase n=1 Tax=Naja naja TaxID=35670 RepID=A0A8C6X8S6_NAJNA